MTLPTDEEIQQAAAEHAQDIQTIIPEHAAQHAFGAHLAGARWALSQTTTLKWKRPEEELPREGEWVAVVSKESNDDPDPCEPSTLITFEYYRTGKFDRFRSPRGDVMETLAWARIPLPDLEGK